MERVDRQRLNAQPAYVLHSYPYRETSLVAEIFSRRYGRLALVARGARRPRSPVRGKLLAFQPLQLSWFGKNELRTLHQAEWVGGLTPPRGMGLICGFYLNELLLKLLPRDDPYEQLFLHYQEALQSLGQSCDYTAILRRFEKCLLKELGYGLQLTHDVHSGEPIQGHRYYDYVVERGPVMSNGGAEGVSLLGSTLLDMARDDYQAPTTQQQSKKLMRILINHYLADQPLHTRQLLKELQAL